MVPPRSFTNVLLRVSVTLTALVFAAASLAERPYIHGHMIMMNGPFFASEDVYDSEPTSLLEVAEPNVAGVVIKYFWRDLETADSTEQNRRYDLSMIDNALSYIEREDLDLKLIVQIMDKSFHNKNNRNILSNPQWVMDAGLDIEYDNSGGGHVAKRWDPRVVGALADVHTAVNQRFKDRPAFAGTATEETALGLSSTQQEAYLYTPEAYRDALIDLTQRIAIASPTTRLFFYMNFLPGNNRYLDHVNAAIAVPPYEVAIGGPDILPGHPPLEKHVYPRFDALPETAYRFNSAQYNSYRHEKTPGEYYSMREIYEFGRDRLGLQLFIWNRPLKPRPPDSYDISDALAVIASEPVEELDTLRRPEG